ncbi:MAG: hypothetical protein ACKOC5_08795, partial [Chloroflexota bacterium]
MSITYPQVSFGLYAMEIKGDSSPSTTTPLQPFSKVADLKTDSTTLRPYATWEPDFWLLDGQYKFLPASANLVHVGLMSLAQSDASGAFAVAPVLTVTFGAVHETDGLVLHFGVQSGDYANWITVDYYDAGDV